MYAMYGEGDFFFIEKNVLRNDTRFPYVSPVVTRDRESSQLKSTDDISSYL